MYNRFGNVRRLSVWTSLSNFAKSLTGPPESASAISPVILFGEVPNSLISNSESKNAINKQLVGSWKVFSDREYGGASTSNVEVKDEILSFSGTIDFDVRDSEEFNKKAKLRLNEDSPESQQPLPLAVKGYSAIKGYFDKTVDLRDHEGLEMELFSSKTQRYILNASFESLFEGDLYQCAIDLPAEKWSKIHVPFSILRLTSGGYERNLQRLSDSLQLETLGFLVAPSSQASNQSEPQNLAFTLKCRSIVALPYLDERIMFKSGIGYK